MNKYLIRLNSSTLGPTSLVLEADDYRVDADGYLSLERDKEEFAHFVPGYWQSIYKQDT